MNEQGCDCPLQEAGPSGLKVSGNAYCQHSPPDQVLFLARCPRTHFFAAADDEELKLLALYGCSSKYAAILQNGLGTCYA